MNGKIQKITKSIGMPLFAIVVSLVIGGFLIIPTGVSPILAYKTLFLGAFGSSQNIIVTLSNATPLLFTGLAAAYAFRAGVFNIGIEGQLYFGGIAAAIVGVYFKGLPMIIHLPLCLIAAMLVGMIWAVIPALLNIRWGIGVFINYIMFNSIAQLFANYLATYPFKGELDMGATYKVEESARLMKLAGPMNDLNLGFIIAIALAIILYVILFKTVFGYESRAAGISPSFTEYIGINSAKKMIIIVLISGAIAGLAGAEQVLGVNLRYINDFSPAYGYTGITVALLARNNPAACIITAIFFGALNTGAIQMEVMTNITRDLVSSIQAIMIIFIAADFSKTFVFKKKQVKEAK